MPRPPHSPWFDLPNNIWGGEQNMKLLIVQLPPFSRYLVPLRSTCFSVGISVKFILVAVATTCSAYCNRPVNPFFVVYIYIRTEERLITFS
jgi:hypothetical protein